MNAHRAQHTGTRVSAGTWSISAPAGFVEYGFYFYMFYTLLGGLFRIEISNAASALLVLLVLFCLRGLGSRIIPVIRTIAFPLGCAIAYIFIQLVFFAESITAMREFFIWMLLLFLVQSLVLRENFLRRFVLVMFLIGLIAMPYMSTRTSQYGAEGEVHRAKLAKGIGFSHTNDMGAWYGFCALYFVVLALTTREKALRILSWSIALGCLYVVTLTVSRGALLALACAGVVACRHVLKSGFLPVLLLVCVGAIVVEMGIFEESVRSYSVRGTEETGRLTVWPLIIDSVLGSPLIGVGAANVGAMGKSHLVNPHNSFLYLAQSSGLITLALFIAYWVRSSRAALQADVGKSSDAVFYLPLLLFTFVTVNLSGLAFMSIWAIVALAIPIAPNVQPHANRSRGLGSRFAVREKSLKMLGDERA